MIKMWTTMDFAKPLSCSKFKPSNSSRRQQKSFWLWILCWWSHSWNDTYKWKNILGGNFQIYVTLAFVQFLPQRLRHAGCNLYWTAFLKRPDLERSYKWNAFLWWFKLATMGFYLWLRRFCNIHPPSLKLLPLMKVTTCRQRENKKFQYGSAQLSKSFYIQKPSLKSIL